MVWAAVDAGSAARLHQAPGGPWAEPCAAPPRRRCTTRRDARRLIEPALVPAERYDAPSDPTSVPPRRAAPKRCRDRRRRQPDRSCASPPHHPPPEKGNTGCKRSCSPSCSATAKSPRPSTRSPISASTASISSSGTGSPPPRQVLPASPRRFPAAAKADCRCRWRRPTSAIRRPTRPSPCSEPAPRPGSARFGSATGSTTRTLGSPSRSTGPGTISTGWARSRNGPVSASRSNCTAAPCTAPVRSRTGCSTGAIRPRSSPTRTPGTRLCRKGGRTGG